MVENSRSGGRPKVKRPPGWYGKAAKAERAVAFAKRKQERAVRVAEQAADRARRETSMAWLKDAASRLLKLPEPFVRKVPTIEEAMALEAARVTGVLRRDRAAAKAERRRKAAEEEMAGEKPSFANLEDTVITPTPEQMRSGEFRPYRPDKTEGTVRSLETVRRVTTNRIVQLHQRGVLDDDTFPACLWYRRTWAACELTLGASVANYEQTIAGERAFGAMPKSARAAEARDMFGFARGGQRIVDDGDGNPRYERWALPTDMLPTFDLVVLHEMTIQDAAEQARCRYSKAALVVKHVALLLHGRIAHLLPTREVGTPGGEPLGTPLDVSEGVGDIDPAFFDERGLLRSDAEISEIIRGRLVDGGDE